MWVIKWAEIGPPLAEPADLIARQTGLPAFHMNAISKIYESNIRTSGSRLS